MADRRSVEPLTFAECRRELRVIAPLDGTEVGTIESLEPRYETVMVRFPVPNSELTDVLEYDPADLVLADAPTSPSQGTTQPTSTR